MTGRVVVISRASSGKGASLAQQLGAAGDFVVLGARRQNELNEVASDSDPRAISVVTGVTRRKDVERLRDVAPLGVWPR